MEGSQFETNLGKRHRSSFPSFPPSFFFHSSSLPPFPLSLFERFPLSCFWKVKRRQTDSEPQDLRFPSYLSHIPDKFCKENRTADKLTTKKLHKIPFPQLQKKDGLTTENFFLATPTLLKSNTNGKLPLFLQFSGVKQEVDFLSHLYHPLHAPTTQEAGDTIALILLHISGVLFS